MVGTLQCADKQGNLVLHDSMEYLPGRRAHAAAGPTLSPADALLSTYSGSARKIGLVLVLRAHRVRVEALSEAAAAASSAAGTA